MMSVSTLGLLGPPVATVGTRTFQGFHVGDAPTVFGLTSKIAPLGSMLNLDADVKKPPTLHQ